MNRIVALLFLAVPLAGCTTTYVEPSAGSTAQVTFKNESDDTVAFVTYYAGAARCTEIQTVERLQRGGETTVKFLANREVTIGMYSVGASGSAAAMAFERCTIIGTFIANSAYSYKMTYGRRGGGCYMLPQRIEGGRALKEPT